MPVLLALVLLLVAVQADHLTPRPFDGYRGIWYMNEKVGGEYVYKYSGGFATYPQWHAPIAVHAAAVGKTFFVLGGSGGTASESGDRLVHLVGSFDHRSGEVSRPVRLLDKQTEDAHDNPVLSIDAAGHLWVFSAAHGTSRSAYIHRSTRPYEIGAWERVATTNFSYPQPWFLRGRGEFLFLHTRYQQGQRSLFAMRSRDGRTWSTPEKLAHVDMGDYQISWPHGDRVGTAFDMHPSSGRAGQGLNYRSNIYYVQTTDAGRTWQTIDGRAVTLPVTDVAHGSRVLDTLAQDRSVYLKDLAYDADGRPVILYLTSRGHQPVPGAVRSRGIPRDGPVRHGSTAGSPSRTTTTITAPCTSRPMAPGASSRRPTPARSRSAPAARWCRGRARTAARAGHVRGRSRQPARAIIPMRANRSTRIPACTRSGPTAMRDDRHARSCT